MRSPVFSTLLFTVALCAVIGATSRPARAQATLEPDEIAGDYLDARPEWLHDEMEQFELAKVRFCGWLCDVAAFCDEKKRECGKDVKCIRLYNKMFAEERDFMAEAYKVVIQEHYRRVQRLAELEFRSDGPVASQPEPETMRRCTCPKVSAQRESETRPRVRPVPRRDRRSRNVRP